jgi:hypothetical protein
MSLSQRDFAFPTSPPVLQSKSSSIDLSTLTRIQSEYAFNSEKYLRDILNFKCIKWQSEACYDYDTRGHCAWSTGSGVGKTALLARLILHFLHTRPFPVIPCTAPTQRQLYNVLWAEIHRAMNQSAILLKLFEWTQERIYLRGHKEDWFAAAITSTAPKPGANTTESLQGYHAEHIMFIIDECCYDDQTDILTDNGWKRFKDLTSNDSVLTLDEKTNIATYVKPIQYHEYDHDGPMYYGKQKGVDFCVTPNHNMYAGFKLDKFRDWQFHSAYSLEKRYEYYVKRDFTWLGKQVNTYTIPAYGDKSERIVSMDWWLQLLGWYLSEGCIQYKDEVPYAVSIAQTKSELNKSLIVLAFAQLGYTPCTYARSVNVHDYQLANHLVNLGKTYNKRIPRYVAELCPKQIKYFLNTFLRGDGYVLKQANQEHYYTSSKLMADDLQELIVKTGSVASITLSSPTGKQSYFTAESHIITTAQNNYLVSRYASDKDAKVLHYNVTKQHYTGKTYCVTVEPSHLLYVRRNGYALWSGNSGIPDQVMGAADGALSTPSARVLMASNPTRNTGYFYRATNDERLKDLWAIKYVDAGMCDAPYIDQSYISRLKQIYGEDSDYFRMRVRGLPPRTEFNALVSPEQVFAAHQRILPKSGVKFISCDPARYGSDDTVIYVRDGNVVLERIAVHGLDTMQVATAVMQLHHIHDAAEIRVDVIGIGAGVCDRIKSELGKQKSRLKEVHVGEDANSKEEFFNKRAEIAWQIRTNIDNLSIPIDTPFLDEELVAIRYGWDSKDKRIKLEPKDETKRSLNPSRSPNDADSLCLLCANLKTPTSIVNAKYFTIGQTNPNDLSTAKLIQSMKDDGKGVRSGLNLAAFLGGKHSVGIGVNRYREFKGDFSENEGFEHLN